MLIFFLYLSAEAAKKQWAQMRDLAQIQIGGSVDPHDPWVYKGPYGEIMEEERNVLGLHGRGWEVDGEWWSMGSPGGALQNKEEKAEGTGPGAKERVEPSRELKRRSKRRRRNAVK